MKKALVVSVILVVLFLLCGPTVFGRSHRHSTPSSFLNLYKVESTVAAGFKQRFYRSFYAITNLEYRNSTSDLELQAGAAYRLPKKILIFSFYGGGGWQVSRNEGFQYPYLIMGTDFLFFFSEIIHPLAENLGPKFRWGFSFHF